jgi:hypothetical protein
VLVVFGEKLLGKAGGVDVDAKKTPFEREPLELLHRRQALTKLSKLSGSPPALIEIM